MRAGESGARLWVKILCGREEAEWCDTGSCFGEGSRVGWVSAHVGPSACAFSLILS